MSETAEIMKDQLLSLSVEDRAELAHFLIHSLDEGSDADVEAAWDVELTRRMQKIQDGTEFGESADSVFAGLREIIAVAHGKRRPGYWSRRRTE